MDSRALFFQADVNEGRIIHVQNFCNFERTKLWVGHQVNNRYKEDYAYTKVTFFNESKVDEVAAWLRGLGVDSVPLRS